MCSWKILVKADWSTDKKDWCCKEHDACLQKNVAPVFLLYSGGWMIGTGVSSGSRGLRAFFACCVESFPSVWWLLQCHWNQDKGCARDEPYDCRAGVASLKSVQAAKSCNTRKISIWASPSILVSKKPTDQPCQRFSPRWPIGRMVGVITKRCSDWTESRFNAQGIQLVDSSIVWMFKPLDSLTCQTVLFAVGTGAASDMMLPAPIRPQTQKLWSSTVDRTSYGPLRCFQVVYDCDAGYGQWESVWSSDKKARWFGGKTKSDKIGTTCHVCEKLKTFKLCEPSQGGEANLW